MYLKVLLSLVSLLAISFCSAKEQTEMEANAPEGANAGNLRYLALGDSYTIGEGVPANESWPVLLSDALDGFGFPVEERQIIASTGWTTADLKAGIERAAPEGPFDLVSLLIGVNNQFRGVDLGYTREDYNDEFAELLQMAISFAGGNTNKVFVLSIPDYSVTQFVSEGDRERVASEIKEYNNINRQIAKTLSVKYFDITTISRQAENNPELLASDRLHPSGRMYGMWVDLMVPEILKML
jgi:lysophospholipase L1-like esterase